ncbi:hypothetical protein LTR36_008971 [Oleoguttula mirabilis]|uniref:Uncharacterized protein n=1 Tax=Oleoguttula mirabilis TaxID=1507867 RepID=A0AAV9J706_9PEZI|nr:hypothetical protein LTR36_008971 [Oleoguttula mirabilis]
MPAETTRSQGAPIDALAVHVMSSRARRIGAQKRPSARATQPKSTVTLNAGVPTGQTPPVKESGGVLQQSSSTAQRPQASPIDPANVFYQPDWTLREAVQQIWLTIRGAHGACKHWLNDYAPNHFSELVRAKKPIFKSLQALCCDIYWIAQFLQFGRQGMDLTDLPPKMLIDAGEILPELVHGLGRLADLEGCGWLHQDAVLPALGVQKMLAEVKQRKDVKEQ